MSRRLAKRDEYRDESRPLRPDKRTIPLHGVDEDDGKYFRCWNCGAICDKDREQLGGPDDKHGVYHDIEEVAGYRDTADPDTLFLGLGGSMALMEVDSDGSNRPIYVTYEVNVSSGCWFCGCRNYR